MAKSSIEWTQFTINPIRARWADRRHGKRSGHACAKVSPGCVFCYSSREQHRFGLPSFDEAPEKYTNGEIEIYLDQAVLQQVLRRRKPTAYFWCSMTDMFWSLVPDEWIDQCFAVMALTPQHRHMVLTKRAERMYKWASGVNGAERFHDLNVAAQQLLGSPHYGAILPTQRDGMVPGGWPLPNVWLGVSAENQKYADERIPWLLKTSAAVRFVSYEPALGPVDFSAFLYCPKCGYGTRDAATHGDHHLCVEALPPRLDWIISGGESGPGARPAHPDWFRSIRDQCKVAGTAHFFKQWGEFQPVGCADSFTDNITPSVLFEAQPDRTVRVSPTGQVDSGDIYRPDDHSWFMERVGKHAAGRLLDGVEHNQLPQ